MTRAYVLFDLFLATVLINTHFNSCARPHYASTDWVYRDQLTVLNYSVFEYTNLTFSHAESPVWDPDGHVLYWVDVLNQNVHGLDYFTGKHSVKHIGYGEVNVVVPIVNSSRLVVGVRAEVYLMDWSKHGDRALRLVTMLDQGLPDNILNEGKADALGRFWAGTKGPHHGDLVATDQAALYRMGRPWFTPYVQLKPVSISNGLAWALNNSVLYYIDSATKKIEAFDFVLETGSLSNRRTLIDITEHGYEEAIPDGMTIDKDGLLWIALMFSGTVIRLDPDTRTIIEKYVLPVSHTTSVTWAGPELDQLVVTTSRRNMKATDLQREPLAGAIFVLTQTGTSGVPAYKVIFDNADRY